LVKDSSLEIPDSPNVALIGLTFLGGSQVSEMSVLSISLFCSNVAQL
jgi:hypothetical protein